MIRHPMLGFPGQPSHLAGTKVPICDRPGGVDNGIGLVTTGWVPPAGIEPATDRLEGGCSIH
jgi:hypothetical protein